MRGKEGREGEEKGKDRKEVTLHDFLHSLTTSSDSSCLCVLNSQEVHCTHVTCDLASHPLGMY